jgi:hypothetical protein
MGTSLPAVLDADSTALDAYEYGKLEKILLATSNKQSIDDLAVEIKEIDELSKKLTRHASNLMDLVENSISDKDDGKPKRFNTVKEKPKVSTVYIAQQIGNLIALKNLKASLLKHNNDLRTTALDRSFKVLNQINKDKKGDGNDELPLDQILDIMVSSGLQISSSGEENLVLVGDYDESELDSLLDDRIQSENVKIIDMEQTEPSTVNSTGTEIFYDQDEDRFYLLNSELEIVEELTEDEIDLEEVNEGEFMCLKHNLPVTFSD